MAKRDCDVLTSQAGSYMPTLGLWLESVLPELHQLKSEGGLFLQIGKRGLLAVDGETILSVHTGDGGWVSVGEESCD